jgi:CTD kinase subunit gamma
MFFIECLCEYAVKENNSGDSSAMGYVRMLQRDILAVVECVVGEEGANIRVVRKVLKTLENLSILMKETVQELEAVLKSREVAHPFMATGSSDSKDGSAALPTRIGGQRMDKRQIEQRIEEDRERHKRLRESIWAVPGDGYEELEKLWEEASDINEDDYVTAREDAEERRKVIAFG